MNLGGKEGVFRDALPMLSRLFMQTSGCVDEV